MVDLRGFEISGASEGPTAHSDPLQFLLFGWWSYLFNFVFGAALYTGRKKKLQSLKNSVLPQFSHSLVCPRCLKVDKRL